MVQKKWKPGDMVRLASGGPDMTVTAQHVPASEVGEFTFCQWFDSKNNLKNGRFQPESLVPVETTEPCSAGAFIVN